MVNLTGQALAAFQPSQKPSVQPSGRQKAFKPNAAASADTFQLKFGLRASELKKRPELYTVTLTPEDISLQDGSVHPTASLVNRVVEKIRRDGDVSKPGFVLIPNASELVKASNNEAMYEEVHQFQDELFGKVKAQLIEHSPQLKAVQYYIHDISFFRPDRLPSKNAPNAYINGKTLKTLHKDAHAILAGQGYGPVRGIEGGSFIIFDDRHFARENGMNVTDLYELDPNDQFPCTPHLKKEWAGPATSSDFIFEIPTIPGKTRQGFDRVPIILMNNLDLGHGATPVKVISDEAERGFYRSNSRIGIPGERGGDPDTEVPPEMPLLPFHDPSLHKLKSK